MVLAKIRRYNSGSFEYAMQTFSRSVVVLVVWRQRIAISRMQGMKRMNRMALSAGVTRAHNCWLELGHHEKKLTFSELLN